MAAINPGVAFDAALVAATSFDDAAASATAAAIEAAPLPTGAARAARLRQAIGLIDLTTLQGDDTAARVRALCATALDPLGDGSLTTAAVCVYPAMVPYAVEALAGRLPVASVAAGFPAGLTPLATRIAEVADCVGVGAAEIDIVIRRSHALEGDWQALYDEVRAFRAAAGLAHLKAIIAVGELGDATTIARASLVCMMAGADVIKTSTGMEKVNATLPAGAIMLRGIADFEARTGIRVGFKPAGGIGTPDQALHWLALVESILGPDWIDPSLFRIGASRLLGAIRDELAG
ncbi:deoxyribose-phosphate aldolase [Sphingomonas naphthae]|uniref:Deoxyribose-phosphate aldolase n=1 Tax=Sphingomonas naphthae TaxID=1813468 RepID=A0ABY7TKL9_9SPHN|nr:deoxyribose-phosphate aldolase [Sphingomonas naphthae]WCT72925.1 deoxyribose-phosphate aldolase [Sphingomonas naphthae]